MPSPGHGHLLGPPLWSGCVLGRSRTRLRDAWPHTFIFSIGALDTQQTLGWQLTSGDVRKPFPLLGTTRQAGCSVGPSVELLPTLGWGHGENHPTAAPLSFWFQLAEELGTKLAGT